MQLDTPEPPCGGPAAISLHPARLSWKSGRLSERSGLKGSGQTSLRPGPFWGPGPLPKRSWLGIGTTVFPSRDREGVGLRAHGKFHDIRAYFFFPCAATASIAAFTFAGSPR